MGAVPSIFTSCQFDTNWAVFSDKAGQLMAYQGLTSFFLKAGFLGVMLFGMNLGLDGRFQVEMAMSLHGVDQHEDQRLQAFAANPGWRARTAPQAAPPKLRRAITPARCSG